MNCANCNVAEKFKVVEALMTAEGLNALIINSFRHYYTQLVNGETGLIDASMIDPIESLPDMEKLEDYTDFGRANFQHAVVIKLNGGLGTSMGLDAAKSLLPAKEDLTFLDIIVRQVLHLRKSYNCSLPLVFMNSFRTEQDTLEALKGFPDFYAGQNDVPVSFVQNKVPKIRQDDFMPVKWPKDPSMEWCPPGHGDIYISMLQTGILDQLLSKGYIYAFVANADNLGAILDPQILGYFAKTGAPFMMEVADRTAADKKGGHLAGTKDGGLILRESAQCPAEEEQDFQDISKYKYFNTNSLWVNLKALKETLQVNNNILALTLIRNGKTVDPNDGASPKVYQLETAMGAAISCFKGAVALRVPRTRFAPIKKTDDLVGLWSDIFTVDENCHVKRSPKRTLGEIVVDLDPKYFKSVSQFRERFPQGVPSLVDCASLKVRGDVVFGKNVILKGHVVIENVNEHQLVIADGSVITG